MNPNNIPFQTTDWEAIPVVEHAGETGHAFWRTLQYGDLRIRMVEYSRNYKANHWCKKGHLIFCLEGEMSTQLADGRVFTLTKGMSYQVSDELSSHLTSSRKGVKLIVVDGAFLQLQPNIA